MLRINDLQNYPRCDSNAQPLAPEANDQKSYGQQNQQLTKTENPVLSTGLDKIMQIYPELRELVKVWPELSEQVKNTIKELVQKNKKEEQK